MTNASPAELDRLRRAVGQVCDPELPPLTLTDLGILRSVERAEDGTVVVTVTPTYSGCPAVEYIEADIARILEANGCDHYRVERAFTPAWTTDWMTADGRRKLIELGIAPPGATTGSAGGATPVTLGHKPDRDPVACPRCGSVDTAEISRFGSTACKSLYRCQACAEPFDHFKAI